MSEITIVENFKQLLAKTFNDEMAKTSKSKILRALDLAIYCHQEQFRANNVPYYAHPIEVAQRIIVEFGINNIDVIVGALLHDTLEDQEEKLIKYINLQLETQTKSGVEALNLYFGEPVKDIVLGVTNPKPSANETRSKYEFYFDHLKEITKSELAFCVKLSDFIDNASTIDNFGPERREHAVKKYGPVLKDIMIPTLKNVHNGHLLYNNKDKLISRLEEIYLYNFV